MGEKKHEPSERRLADSRRDGKWYSSKELTGAAILGLTAVMLSSGLALASQSFVDLIRFAWQPERIASADPLNSISDVIEKSAYTGFGITAAVDLSIFAAALIVTFLQVKALFSVKPLLNPQKLNFAKNFQNLFFSPTTYQKLAISIVKAILMLGLVSAAIWSSYARLLSSHRAGALQQAKMFLPTFTSFFWQATALYLVYGIADFFLERRKFLKELRMDDEELRQEQRQEHGDQEIKAHMRHQMQQIIQARGKH